VPIPAPPWPLRTESCAAAGRAYRLPPGSRRCVLLRALLRDTSEQCPDFRLPVPAVPAKGTDRSQFPGLGPPRDGLRVNPEHGRDLCWGQQRLGLWRTCRHVDGLSSWTGTAILRSCVSCSGCPLWSTQTILPSPAVTSRPPGAKDFLARSFVAPSVASRCVILATRSVATGRFGKVIPPPTPQHPSSIASTCRHLARSRWCMAAASSNCLLARALTAADTSATDWSARSASSSSSCTNPP